MMRLLISSVHAEENESKHQPGSPKILGSGNQDTAGGQRKIPPHLAATGFSVEPPARIELATFSLRVKRSTD
jgi:hypothetical protein